MLPGCGEAQSSRALVGGGAGSDAARPLLDVVRYEAAVGDVRGVKPDAEFSAGRVVGIQGVDDACGELQFRAVCDAQR